MKVLITGVAGFIPSHLAEGLLAQGFEVLGVDNFATGFANNMVQCQLNPNFRFEELNVNELAQIAPVFNQFQPDYVFHYAAFVGVKRTLESPLSVLSDIRGIENILELSSKAGVKRVFFSSSSEVYGEPVEFPQNEDTTPLNSKLPYAVVKNLGEVYLKTFQKEYGLNYTIFRFFNTYGPRQSGDFVISKFIKAALQNKPLTVYGKGDQTRTFCYISDNITATIKALQNEDFANKIINIGSNSELKILDLAKKVILLTNSKSVVEHLPPLKEGDMTRRLPTIDNMRKLLGKDLKVLDEGLSETIEYFSAYVED